MPPADGGVAHALLRLGLLRAWASSDAALRETLRRRVLRAAALTAALDAGRWPTRHELAAWTSLDGTLQLAFPELLVPGKSPAGATELRAAVTRHVLGVEEARRRLDASADADAVRADHLRRLRREHPGARLVAFTSFADTARALYRRLRDEPGVALVTAGGAWIASGRIGRQEVLRAFEPARGAREVRARTISLLLATDVLSEGLDLQRASVVVHLDLPWTAARLEQRVGRVRRIGSPNVSVFVYACGGPGGGPLLRPVVSALRRKARLMRATSAATGLDVHAALVGTQPGHSGSRARPRDPAALAETLRQRLGEWLQVAEPPIVAADELLQGWMPEGPLHGEWSAIALARVGAMLHLAVLSPPGAREDIDRLLDVLDSLPLPDPRAGWSGGRRPVVEAALVHRKAAARASTCQETRDAVMPRALAAAHRWLAELRGARLAAPARLTPAIAHRRALREIDRLVSRAPRHRRADLAARGAECRRLLLRARGAGAERSLADWLAGRARAGGAPDDPLAALDALRDMLHPWDDERRDSAETAPAVLLAVLALGGHSRPEAD